MSSSYIGVKIQLDRFVDVCRILFKDFDKDCEQYILTQLQEFPAGKQELSALTQQERTDLLLDFLGDNSNHYFRSSLDDEKLHVVIFEWCPPGQRKDAHNIPTSVFGISLKGCDKESMFSMSCQEVVNRMQAVKKLIKYFDVAENSMELVVQSY